MRKGQPWKVWDRLLQLVVVGEASDMVLGKNKAVRLGKEGWTQQEHSELGTVSSWRARRAQTTRTREKAVQ